VKRHLLFTRPAGSGIHREESSAAARALRSASRFKGPSIASRIKIIPGERNAQYFLNLDLGTEPHARTRVSVWKTDFIAEARACERQGSPSKAVSRHPSQVLDRVFLRADPNPSFSFWLVTLEVACFRQVGNEAGIRDP